MSRRAAVFLGALSPLGAACAPMQAQRADTTGQSGGGIGGTGTMADASGPVIFGTITALGSIELNGLHIEVPAGVAAGDLLDTGPASLAVGQSVAVATGRAGDALVARRVVQILPLVGVVEGVDTLQRRITVMGTSVQVAASTPLHDRDGDVALPLSAIGPGDWLAVSGLWRERTVVASRIERLPPQAAARATGLLQVTDGLARIGGTALAGTAGTEPGFAAVTGTYRDGRLVAERVVTGAVTLFPTDLDRLVVEAFLARNQNDPGYHLSGFGIPMDPASAVPPTVGRRSILVGRYDGSFLIERSFPVPEEPGARRGALKRIDMERLLE
jgi:hypothetical protein